ncbi:FeoB-associated Cys-rich membrane protein [Intestinimonas sp. MSJ-38]|uniref:FeoB-associated Cys-rich membrane protein n=1 Tax=Intestinimonas sp. MSJ-38 TaxID=2841532 RepID=UPI00352FD76D
MGFGDILLLLLLAFCAVLAFRAIRRGQTSCSSGCSACPMAGKCHKPQKHKSKQK